MKDLQAIVIAGPTASGKTALGVNVARLTGGPVINADSMQVYDILSIITARPQPDEMGGVEHLLFGHVPPQEAYSVARYLEDVSPVLQKLKADGIVPVFVGGTGLYFKALTEGLHRVPEIDPAIRKSLREASERNIGELYIELAQLDPEGAAQLRPGDTQRILRALEVVRSTGKPLAWWQENANAEPLLDANKCLKIVLLPDRTLLRERIELRFRQMIENGGLEEIRALLALNLDKDLPAMRAIGVRQMLDYFEGNIDLEKALELAVNATRQYAKRQSTWFRNQFEPASDGDILSGWHRCGSAEEAQVILRKGL